MFVIVAVVAGDVGNACGQVTSIINNAAAAMTAHVKAFAPYASPSEYVVIAHSIFVAGPALVNTS